jgi:hypothetical protein
MAVEFNNHAACAYVAKENGWYEAEGINLTTYESYASVGDRFRNSQTWLWSGCKP